MATIVPRASDLGIIFAKNGNGSGTYTDITGRIQQIGLLTLVYSEQITVLPSGGLVDYSHPYVGGRYALSLEVRVTLASADGVYVRLQGRYADSDPWADLQTVRQDTGGTASEHLLSSTGYYAVQTTSALAMPQIRVVGRYVGAALSVGDFVEVKGWVS